MNRETRSVAPSASEAFGTAEDECLQVALALGDAARIAGEPPGGPKRRAQLLHHAGRIARDAVLRIELLMLDVGYGLQVIDAEREIDDFTSGRHGRRRESWAA